MCKYFSLEHLEDSNLGGRLEQKHVLTIEAMLVTITHHMQV